MNHRLKLSLWTVLVGLTVWAAIIQGQAAGFNFKCQDQPGGCSEVGKPILAVELARSGDTFKDIINWGNCTLNIHVMRVNTRMDFVFIALYWTLFVLFARYYNNRWSKWVIALISVAAVCDLLENFRILACLRALEQNHAISLTPGIFGYPKWIAFCAAVIALGLLVEVGDGKYQRILTWCLFGLAVTLLTTVAKGGGLAPPPSPIVEVAIAAAMILVLILPLLLALVLYYPFPIAATLKVIEYSYLIRFQIIFALLLAVVLPAFYWVIPSIFVGIFDAVSWWSLALVVWAAFQLAWILMITSRLVLVYGGERFPGIDTVVVGNVGTRTVVLFGMLAVPFVFVLSLGTLDPFPLQKVIGIAIGLAAAVLGLYLTARLQYFIEDDTGNTANRVFPSFGVLQHTSDKSRSRFWKFADDQIKKLPPKLQAGLIREDRLRSGHQLAAIAVAGLLTCYVALGFSYLPHLVSPEKQPAAVLYVLLLLSILTWVLSGVAFFLDVLRVPVLTTLLTLSLLTGLVRTDHQFVITPHTSGKPLPPALVIEAWVKEYRDNHPNQTEPKTAIIVATAGGGIRASAWTAEVLTQLGSAAPEMLTELGMTAEQKQQCASEFSSSLLLISSVSGGSVGAMSVLNGYGDKRSFPNDDAAALEKIRFNAYHSSLSAVGWGLLYPDFSRTVPFFGSLIPQAIDRGWALESAWISGWHNPPNVSDWRAEVAVGTRPAIIFNATGAENGKRFIVASADLDAKNAVRFFRDFPGFDLPVSTAARLSASFPYVSPETRSSSGPDLFRVHVGDGGYYDNSGILSAVEWLHAAQDTLKPYKLLFIIIDARPSLARPTMAWSWQRQITGPLETLLSVRTSSQSDRDKLELDLERKIFADVWKQEPAYFIYEPCEEKKKNRKSGEDNANACPERPVKKKPLTSLLRPDESTPLSWHLNKAQIEAIRDAWRYNEHNIREASRVCSILQGEK